MRCAVPRVAENSDGGVKCRLVVCSTEGLAVTAFAGAGDAFRQVAVRYVARNGHFGCEIPMVDA